MVALLETTCTTPIGVHARIAVAERAEKAAGEAVLTIDAFVGLPDGSEWLRDRVEGDAHRPAAVGEQLAERLIAAGARDILDRAEEWANVSQNYRPRQPNALAVDFPRYPRKRHSG